MDKIDKSESAMSSVKKALNVFEENSTATATSRIKDLQETLSKLDDKYKNEIIEYVEQIHAFIGRGASFVEENTIALEQRSKRIVACDSNSYKKGIFFKKRCLQ